MESHVSTRISRKNRLALAVCRNRSFRGSFILLAAGKAVNAPLLAASNGCVRMGMRNGGFRFLGSARNDRGGARE